MAEARQRAPLQFSYSFSATSSTPSSSSDPAHTLKRSASTEPTPTLPPAMTTLPTPIPSGSHTLPPPQSHYPHASYTAAAKSTAPRSHGSSRAGLVGAIASPDVSPDDEGVVFIHAPFTDFPDAHKYKDGLTYSVLAENPNWFLVPSNFQTINGGNPDGVKYPQQLEPPRGWCPAKKKENKDGWPEGEEPRLRCTCCRRTYAGVNAKSMWRRHVFEKHKIAMSNRRADAQERKGRGSNKENKDDVGRLSERSSTARGAAKAEAELEAQSKSSSSKSKFQLTAPDWHGAPSTISRSRSLPTSVARQDDSENDSDEAEQVATMLLPAFGDPSASTVSIVDLENDIYHLSASSSTPPLTPGSPSSSFSRRDLIIPESPYNPLLTPSFRHSPPRLPSDQPWRFNDPNHPLCSAARDLSLSMLVCGEASPVVSGLDVSPVVLRPASARTKRSIYSSPLYLEGKTDMSSPDSDFFKSRGFPKPSPRRLFSDTGLPTPFTDRLKSTGRWPETPKFLASTPLKSRPSSLRKGTLFRSAFSPYKSPSKAGSLLGPIELDGDDPFAEGIYKTLLAPGVVDDRIAGPPDSDPECESPVLRSSQLSRPSSSSQSFSQPSSSLSQAASKVDESSGSAGRGLGLMEGFSLKQSASKMTLDDPVDIFISTPIKSSAKRPRAASGFKGFLASPIPASSAGKKRKPGFLMDRYLDGDSDLEINELLQAKKRRKTKD